jgi:hypothetical protein
MKMNRRSFLISGAALSVVPSGLLLEGCTASIVDLINTVLNAAANVLVVAEPGAPWVAQMQQAIVALQQAEQSWQAGGAVAVVIDALNTIEAVCAVIPFTAQYSVLISVLVAGIEAVLALFPAQAVQVSKAKIAVPNPYIGRFTLVHKAFKSRPDEFKTAWNALCTGPLVGAAIK